MDDSMTGQRVLVTGAGGFIGSHASEALLDAGAGVRALFRYTSGHSLGALAEGRNVGEIDLRFGDLRDSDTVDRVVSGVDIVLHLGAQVSVPFSYQSPRDVVETNVLGTLNVLTA